MADKKISELDAIGTSADTDQIPVVQSGTTKRATLAQLMSAGGVEGLEAAWSNTVVVEGDNSTRTTKATAVQTAIDAAAAASKSFVFVPQSFLNYDASAVTFDNSVRMVREGQVSDVFDVKAYGAAGDGSVDDTAALEAAAAAASADGGGVVLAPIGTYLIGNAVTWPSQVGLFGSNQHETLFKVDDSDLDFLTLTDAEYATLRDFQVDYGSASTGGQSGTAVRIKGDSHNLVLSDLFLQDCFRGVHTNNMWMTRVQNVRVDDAQDSAFVFDGETAGGSGAGTTLYILNCYANRPGSHAFVIDSYQTAVVVACAVDGMSGGGSLFRVQGASSNVHLIQPHGENNDLPNSAAVVEVTGASSAVRVHGGFATGTESSGGTASYFDLDASSGDVSLYVDGFRGISLGTAGSIRQHVTGGANTASLVLNRIDLTTDTGSTSSAGTTRIHQQDRQGRTTSLDLADSNNEITLSPGDAASSDRLDIQAQRSDKDIEVLFLPSGTSTVSRFGFSNGSDLSGTNFGRLRVEVDGSDAKILTDSFGTGTAVTDLHVGSGEITKIGFYGSTPVTKPSSLTAADGSVVDGTYGTEERDVIQNLVTRVGELESKLQSLGLLS